MTAQLTLRQVGSEQRLRFNNRRLLEPIGYIPPAEAEVAYYASLEELKIAA